MKRLLPFLFLVATPLFAEQVTVRESAILKGERTVISIKAGTEVELIARGETTATIKFRNVTGIIPPAKPVPPVAAQRAREMQTNYGKAVQKARTNAAAHEKAMVDPTDKILK